MIVSPIKTVVGGGFYLHPMITKDFLIAYNKLDVKGNTQGMFLQTAVKRPYHLLTARESGLAAAGSWPQQ